jgi:hypothetical protein
VVTGVTPGLDLATRAAVRQRPESPGFSRGEDQAR